MISSFKKLHFIFNWRPYQAKVLANFSSHIHDNHFHIVAPPGSGKTILGIELIRRIGKKTIILAPTLTIRNQWEDRLQNFFTENCDFINYSFNIKKPSDITFTTYQGLHAFYKQFDNDVEYFNHFKKHNIDVLLLDEAHHLKNEWWKCLYNLKEQQNQTIIALTATPPYDSSGTELQKYFKLCGEIDDEIAVPDLVKEHNLCPHQDLVFFSKPNEIEIDAIVKFRLSIADFINQLLKDEIFISFLQNHRFYKNTEQHLEEIYKNTSYFSSILIFLHNTGVKICKDKLLILGFEKKTEIDFPQANHYWIELLLQHLLVTDREVLISEEKYLLHLEKKLRTIGGFSKNKVCFLGNDTLYKSLSSNPSKLKSITTIANKEYNNLKDDLRCVILSDYIRKEFLQIKDHAIQDINKLGVVPIFQKLRKQYHHKHHIGVLTGSLVIIHSNCIAKLELLEPLDNFIITPLVSDTAYVTLTPTSKNNKSLVYTITKLFEQGVIKVLIGTKSLLGEGWDAPAINSLILASVVGSFVTSNQMRGRAIRVTPNNPNKVGLIWHLACIDPTDEQGGKDVEILSRRFTAFLGIGSNNTITNGIDRLHLPDKITTESISDFNTKTLHASENRKEIVVSWQKAIHSGKNIAKEFKLNHFKDKKYSKQHKLYYKDLVKYSTSEIIIGLTIFFPNYFIKNIHVLISKGVLTFLYSLFTGLAFVFGYKIVKTSQLYFRYGFIHKKLKKMGYAVLDTLYDLDFMSTPKTEIEIIIENLDNGSVNCIIKNASRYESTLFVNALDEILAPVNNPKYLLTNTNWFKKKLEIINYFSVPDIFGSQKKNAIQFQSNWKRYLGKSDLIFTRNLNGRKKLLQARLLHVENNTEKITEKNVVWK